MKLHFNRLILAVLFIIGAGTAWSQANSSDTDKVIVILSNKRSKVANYVYKDLSRGFRMLKYKAQVSIGSYQELNESLFKSYDAVVLVSERQTSQLDPTIQPFVQKNAANKQLVVVAFLPRNNKGLGKLPTGVDALSSASMERPASRLVVNQVAAEVMKRIKGG